MTTQSGASEGASPRGRGVGGRFVAAVAVGDTPKEARRRVGLDALDVAAHFQIAVRVVGIRERYGNRRVALYIAVFLPLGGVREPQQLAVPVEPYRTYLHRTVGPGRRQVSVQRAFKQIVVAGGNRNHIRSYLDLFCADDSGGNVERRVLDESRFTAGVLEVEGLARWSDLCHATIDAQFDAGHEAAVIGGQKQCSGCDLLGAAQPVKWYRRGELRLVGLSVQHGSVDRAPAQRVEPDAAIVELAGPGAGIGPQRGLGGAVGTVTGNAEIA